MFGVTIHPFRLLHKAQWWSCQKAALGQTSQQCKHSTILRSIVYRNANWNQVTQFCEPAAASVPGFRVLGFCSCFGCEPASPTLRDWNTTIAVENYGNKQIKANPLKKKQPVAKSHLLVLYRVSRMSAAEWLRLLVLLHGLCWIGSLCLTTLLPGYMSRICAQLWPAEYTRFQPFSIETSCPLTALQYMQLRLLLRKGSLRLCPWLRISSTCWIMIAHSAWSQPLISNKRSTLKHVNSIGFFCRHATTASAAGSEVLDSRFAYTEVSADRMWWTKTGASSLDETHSNGRIESDLCKTHDWGAVTPSYCMCPWPWEGCLEEIPGLSVHLWMA